MMEVIEINGVQVYFNPHPWRNRTLIAMQSHGAVDDALARNWHWLLESGCDIVVSYPEDDPSKVFKGPLLGKVIRDGPRDFYKLQERAMMLLEVIRDRLKPFYDSVMLLHYDCMFFKPLPNRLPKGLETFRYEHSYQGFRTNWKACLPWWFDWETLSKFMKGARCNPVDLEQGYMDHWIPAICDEFTLTVTQTDLISFPCTNVEAEDRVDQARDSIQAGRPFVHGVKTKKALDWVLTVAGLESRIIKDALTEANS